MVVFQSEREGKGQILNYPVVQVTFKSLTHRRAAQIGDLRNKQFFKLRDPRGPPFLAC
jgi:hypothetical protein